MPEKKFKVRRGWAWEGVSPSHSLEKKSRTKWWLLLHFMNLNTDLIASKTKVKNSQNPIALVQKYCRMGILQMIGIHQLVYKDVTRVRHVLLHFSRFKTFLFFGHSKIKVRSCIIYVYSGTPLDVHVPEILLSEYEVIEIQLFKIFKHQILLDKLIMAF